MAFLTTSCETSDGIVTTTVPARRSTSEASVRSRSVPGGRSSSSRSSSPQLVSVRNSRSALASIAPRQVWASSWVTAFHWRRSEEHTSELQSRSDLVCRLLLEKKKKRKDGEDNQKEHNKMKQYNNK